ncbi:LCP family protein [Actinoplanes palleronii]|uniref:LCP family protein n=1 Tax=Actinoplanes palleronii TaxID=113570 RepID=UPI0019433E38|nr:LCP family protein [Actinoplanes palleronii]
MSTVEEELRAAFQRHEETTPDAGPLRHRIDAGWVRVKRRRARRRVIGAAAAVLLAGLAVQVVSSTWGHGGQPEAVTLDAVVPGDGANLPAEPVDVLLIGADPGADTGTPRADTVMLLHVPADRGAVWMVSLPRDGLVSTSGARPEKLSWVLSTGGPRRVAKAVTTLTGVTPDATVVVDLAGLRGVTDAVGGVRMCLDEPVTAQFGRKGLAKGCQQIDGAEVESLLRARLGMAAGSLERDRNGQRFLRALTAKVTAGGVVDLPAAQRLLTAAAGGITVDGDLARLVRVVGDLGSPQLIGISEPVLNTPHPEKIYPTVGESLFPAIRDDGLTAWAAANPGYVTR